MEKNLIILGLVTLFCICSFILIWKKMKEGFGAYNLKAYGITIVVFASLFVVLSDISPEKTAACFGIFGSIAGYLFGIKEKENNSSSTKSS